MNSYKSDSLSNDDINRYSRQIILQDFGVTGQLKLKSSSVLIVGAGGLGCPCALYLAGAGVGRIGLVDYDLVELSNIHRQILHKEAALNKKKVESASESLREINSKVEVFQFHLELNSANVLNVLESFNIVVDASDNVATRYLLNDACFFLKKPLVSGSALQMEGQLTVYHHQNVACYRCLFPEPPPPDAVTNCGEGGVLGVIPGTIGVLQALQVINILVDRSTLAGYLLLFNGNNCSFNRIKLRLKHPDCKLCGQTPEITKPIDYEKFCQAKANDKDPKLKLLDDKERISVKQYYELQSSPHLLIDVRSSREFEICHLSAAINIPIKSIQSGKGIDDLKIKLDELPSGTPAYVVCRRGNDSQRAIVALKKDLPSYTFKDIIGGLHSWTKEIDSTFPIY